MVHWVPVLFDYADVVQTLAHHLTLFTTCDVKVAAADVRDFAFIFAYQPQIHCLLFCFLSLMLRRPVYNTL